jgi:hypothetical protein
MGNAQGQENTGYSNSIGNSIGQLAQAGLSQYMSNRAARQQQQVADQQRQLSQDMMARMDPFGPQRAQYGAQLQQLTQNPQQALLSNPILAAGYRQALEQGNRQMAASGNLGSGARVAALAQLAPAYLGNIYNQEANRLGQLAGANIHAPSGIQAAFAEQGAAQNKMNQAKQQQQRNYLAFINSLIGGGNPYASGTLAGNLYG